MSFTSILPIALPIILILLVIGIIGASYVKAAPDKAYIISGYRKKPQGANW